MKYKYRIVKRKSYDGHQDKFHDWYDLEQEARDHRVIEGWIMKKNRWYQIHYENSLDRMMEWIVRREKSIKAQAVEANREVIDTFELDVDFLSSSRTGYPGPL